MASPAPQVPDDRFYDADHHLWVAPDPGKESFKIGLDAVGLEALGELTYVSLPEPGKAVRRGEPFGTLEAAKMTSPLVTPVSGTVLARNEVAVRDPTLVNRDPYGSGWLVVLSASHWKEEQRRLLSGPDIRPWAEREIQRLRSGLESPLDP